MSEKLIRSPYYLVKEFHETYEQAIRTTPTVNVPEREMRLALIVEEAAEYREAVETNDFIEIADALADLVYVAYGAAITHGVDIDYWFISPVQVYPESFDGTTYGSPSLFTSNREENKIPSIHVKEWRYLLDSIEQAVEDYRWAITTTDPNNIAVTLYEIVFQAYTAADAYGIDLDEVLLEVQRSNLSKLEDGQVLRREDGKILKGKDFFAPDIAKVLKNQGWE